MEVGMLPTELCWSLFVKPSWLFCHHRHLLALSLLQERKIKGKESACAMMISSNLFFFFLFFFLVSFFCFSDHGGHALAASGPYLASTWWLQLYHLLFLIEHKKINKRENHYDLLWSPVDCHGSIFCRKLEVMRHHMRRILVFTL